MSLTALEHSFIITDRPVDNTIEEWLNNIYDACNGNMTHWTCSRYQNGGTTEAVYFEPVGGQAATDGLRVIFAGVDSGSPTPPMGLNVSFDVDRLFVGLAYDGGAFNAWDNAAPFTSGEFSGYLPCGDTGSQTVTSMRIGETAETIVYLQIDGGYYAEGGNVVAGAIIDAESTDSTNSINDDGRVFGVITSGYQNTGDFYDLGVDTNAWTHGNGTTDSKAVYLQPNGTTWEGLIAGPSLQYSGNTLKQRDGSPWIAPIFFCQSGTPYRMVGRLREIGLGPISLTGNQLYGAGDTAVALLWSYSTGGNPYVSAAFKY